MKWKLLIIMVLALPSVAATLCEERLDNGSSCIMLTPSISCTAYNYDIYNKSGAVKVSGGSLTQANGSIYYFNFTQETGDYIIKLCDDSTREMRVTESYDTKFQKEEDARVDIAFIMGVLGIIAILLWISFKLENEHYILKLLLILTAVSLIVLIPVNFVITDPSTTFYKAIMTIMIIFWLYVGGYFVYWIINRMRDTVEQY